MGGDVVRQQSFETQVGFSNPGYCTQAGKSRLNSVLQIVEYKCPIPFAGNQWISLHANGAGTFSSLILLVFTHWETRLCQAGRTNEYCSDRDAIA